MAYVITELCASMKDTSCVDVCPVDCIHPTSEEEGYDTAAQLYIDPTECIDCDACVHECPVGAIFAGDRLPAEYAGAAAVNAEHYRTASR